MDVNGVAYYESASANHRVTQLTLSGSSEIDRATLLSLAERFLLPSTLPSDSGKPSSSPTLKPAGENYVVRVKAAAAAKFSYTYQDRNVPSRRLRGIYGINHPLTNQAG
jgi:hypothetical protein